MNKHFAYLFEDDQNEFFQKAAEEEAQSVVAKAMAITKAPIGLLEKQANSPFEKLASRIDQDLYILKTAGSCGTNLGMIKRAEAYVDRLFLNDDRVFTEDEFDILFDKIATAAILADIESAKEELKKEAAPELHRVIDREVNTIGQDLVRFSHMEKEAFGAAARAIGGLVSKVGPRAAARGAASAGAKGATRGAIAGGKSVGRALSAPFRAVGSAVGGTVSKIRDARLRKATSDFSKVRSRMQAAQSIKNPDVKKGVMDSLTKQRAAADKKLSQRVDAGWGGEKFNPKKYKKKNPAAATQKATELKTIKGESGRSRAQQEAAAAAKPAKAPEPPPKPSTAAGAADDVAMAAKDAPAKTTVSEAWKAFQEKGWKGLSPTEKNKLMQAGAGGLVGYRALTGSGALTGGEGLI